MGTPHCTPTKEPKQEEKKLVAYESGLVLDQKLFLSTHPPTDAEAQELASGLVLDQRPLEPPRFHQVSWKDGQKFTELHDPDRTQEALDLPSFVHKSPQEQFEKMSVEELDVGSEGFARVVHNILDEHDCAEFITAVNKKGFTPALLNIGGGRQQLQPYVRNGHRVIADSAEIGSWFFEVLRPYIPSELYGGKLVELNDRLRFLCYTPGQEFPMHMDGNYTRPLGHPRALDTSRVTVQIYLHDVPEQNGGATTFAIKREKLPCQPKAGSALIFSQNLMHEGSLLKKGLKYTLRTEAMYSRRDTS